MTPEKEQPMEVLRHQLAQALPPFIHVEVNPGAAARQIHVVLKNSRFANKAQLQELALKACEQLDYQASIELQD